MVTTWMKLAVRDRIEADDELDDDDDDDYDEDDTRRRRDVAGHRVDRLIPTRSRKTDRCGLSPTTYPLRC